jgi:hypothetical protein
LAGPLDPARFGTSSAIRISVPVAPIIHSEKN